MSLTSAHSRLSDYELELQREYMSGIVPVKSQKRCGPQAAAAASRLRDRYFP